MSALDMNKTRQKERYWSKKEKKRKDVMEIWQKERKKSKERRKTMRLKESKKQ